jgi:putative transposase
VSANQADANKSSAHKLSAHTMCRVLGVSPSGYYDWLHRAPSARVMANAVLTESNRQVHKDSDETYGMPRIRAELQDHGQHVSRKRVAPLMRKACIRGISRRRGFTVTTERDRRQRPAPDLVNRQFRAPGPDQLWVADMTYIPDLDGFPVSGRGRRRI